MSDMSKFRLSQCVSLGVSQCVSWQFGEFVTGSVSELLCGSCLGGDVWSMRKYVSG